MGGYSPSPIFPGAIPQVEILGFLRSFAYPKHLQFILFFQVGEVVIFVLS
jgi:hypothetical protein